MYILVLFRITKLHHKCISNIYRRTSALQSNKYRYEAIKQKEQSKLKRQKTKL